MIKFWMNENNIELFIMPLVDLIYINLRVSSFESPYLKKRSYGSETFNIIKVNNVGISKNILDKGYKYN